jgi:hypothetical protein
VSAGTEHFAWSEDTSPFKVKESGPRFALGLALTQHQAAGLTFAYRGKVYAGEVGYDGAYLFDQTVPVSGKTVYLGTTQQGQVRYGFGPRINVLGGLDFDLWRRRLGSTQTEDYSVVSIRLGAERGAAGRDQWRMGAGLKLPIWAREDAHFTAVGFAQNPILEPGRVMSPYAEISRRLALHWWVSGYWDGFRFTQSNRQLLRTRRGARPSSIYQPASDLRIIGISLERDF